METPFIHRKVFNRIHRICHLKNLAAESEIRTISVVSYGLYLQAHLGGHYLKYMESGRQSIHESDVGARQGSEKKFLKSLQKGQ